MQLPTSLTFKSSAPSNIAFIKYWGKYGIQLPINPSVSMTLKKSITHTSWEIKAHDKFVLEVYLDGNLQKSFNKKIEKWLSLLGPDFDFLKKSHNIIRTSNTFPHSTGIASSASAFAALSVCLTQIHAHIKGSELEMEQISHLARLGSGSACRSLEGPLCEWGATSIEYATPLKDIHETYMHLKDAICIVSSTPKKFSSSLGHGLMKEHRYRDARIEQANSNYKLLRKCLNNGDVWKFGEIIEDEAMSLHALMMTSQPSYTLLDPSTLIILNKIKSFREEYNIPVFFTLDAGPNVHLIYFADNEDKIKDLINNEIAPFLDQDVIYDEIGSGAKVES